jgi:hypothetical protein
VPHDCNPSDSGGRNQDDHSSKPILGKQFAWPYPKKKNHKKRTGGLAQDVGPEFKPQYHTHTYTNSNNTFHRNRKTILKFIGKHRNSWRAKNSPEWKQQCWRYNTWFQITLLSHAKKNSMVLAQINT